MMYIHGRGAGQQLTRLAISRDGLNFEGAPEVLGRPYFRVIEHGDYHYALSMRPKGYSSQPST
ncbi:hypothetical protein OAE08_02400 [Gammaproteobacteria bacterium]|nr:hypothetical protein [Gammaproteobacteria bacterium]